MLNLATIYPLIVPQSYYSKGTWNLPHEPFPNKNYILTWVFFEGDSAMTYITEDNHAQLNGHHPGWQQTAFENLRLLAEQTNQFTTHHNLRDDNKKTLFLGFLNQDGIGSSRILLSHEMKNAFPQGYHIAFPDRSCGLIIPADLSKKEYEGLQNMVKKMQKDATTSMSDIIHAPAEFLLPESWLEPIDPELSTLLVKNITSQIS